MNFLNKLIIFWEEEVKTGFVSGQPGELRRFDVIFVE